MARPLVAAGVLLLLAGAAEAQPSVTIVTPPPRPSLPVPEAAPEAVVAAFELQAATRRFWQARDQARRYSVIDARDDRSGTKAHWAELNRLHLAATAQLDGARLSALETWLAGAPRSDGIPAARLVAAWLRIDAAERNQGDASAPDYGPARQHLEEVLRRQPDGPLARAARIELAYIAGNEEQRLTMLQQVACPVAFASERPESVGYDRCARPAADDPATQYAWAALAALHLDRDEPAPAALAAGRLEDLPDSPYHPAALYYQAYALYRLQDYPAALLAFDRLTGEQALAPEAWEYITLILYGMPDGLERAAALFRTDSRPQPRAVLVGMAELYRADDRPADAIRALELAIEGWPEHSGLPRTAHQIVTLDVQVNGKGKAAVRGVLLADRLLREGDWYRANSGNAEAIARRDRFLEEVLLFVGEFFLALAEDPAQRMAVPTAERAAEAFALLLREVPDSPARYRTTFGRGRALELQGQLGEARAEYELVRDQAGDPDLRAAAERRLAALSRTR